MNGAVDKLKLFLRRPSGVLGIAILVAVTAMALTAGHFFPDGPTRMVARPLLWPGQQAGLLLGTDRMGSDILAGIMYGARASLLVGLSAAAVSIVVGTLVGAVSGYYRGWADDVLMRITDAVQTIPSFLAAVVIVGVVGASLTSVIISISI
ncbi:ABC transporter permease, partial [Comamonas sp. SCN 67-35]|uniref:ABC transporter permease n=1 Tax=Comamonas sp. SCN 67-35 TaxID=1660096 RepID=UPI000ACEBC90